jgi:hypothetical protein
MEGMLPACIGSIFFLSVPFGAAIETMTSSELPRDAARATLAAAAQPSAIDLIGSVAAATSSVSLMMQADAITCVSTGHLMTKDADHGL